MALFVRFQDGVRDEESPELFLRDGDDYFQLTYLDLTTTDGEILAQFINGRWFHTSEAEARWPVLTQYGDKEWTDIVLAWSEK